MVIPDMSFFPFVLVRVKEDVFREKTPIMGVDSRSPRAEEQAACNMWTRTMTAATARGAWWLQTRGSF